MHIIVPDAPGITPDIMARMMAQWLSERLDQPFIVENHPGGGQNLGTELVVRAPADGYALLLITLAAAVNATLYDDLNFNFIRDITHVSYTHLDVYKRQR